jgi:hypothetical protein
MMTADGRVCWRWQRGVNGAGTGEGIKQAGAERDELVERGITMTMRMLRRKVFQGICSWRMAAGMLALLVIALPILVSPVHSVAKDWPNKVISIIVEDVGRARADDQQARRRRDPGHP